MNDEQLQQLVENISFRSFEKKFKHQAVFNHRLRSTGGRYLLRSHNIEINKKYYEEHGQEELIGIIKHELCHYHLHIEGKGYQHRDIEFKKLLSKVGAPRFCSPLKNQGEVKTKSKVIHEYVCNRCSTIFKRRRKVNVDRYVCGKCGGKLKKRNNNLKMG